MAERFEYDVVNLKAEYDANDHRKFRWKSKRGGCQDVDQDGLENLLNDRGRHGWSVVAFDTDARFGSNLVLQRALPDQPFDKKAPKNDHAPLPVASPPIVVSAPPIDLAPLLAELQALRHEVAEQRSQQWMHQPMDAAKRWLEEELQRQAEESSRQLHSEAFREAIQPVLEELKAQRELKPISIGPVTATMTSETAREIGMELARALAPKDSPIASQVEPKFERRRPRLFNWAWVTGIGR